MAMNNAMQMVRYEVQNFNEDLRERRHPLYITERHFIYKLELDSQGSMQCSKDRHGNPITSARSLRELCVLQLILEHQVLCKTPGHLVPCNVFPLLLSEAIYLRETHAIVWAVWNWPMKVLRVHDVIPREEYLDDEYLTFPIEGNSKMCLADCFVLGLLKLQASSNLKYVDFSGFGKDRKLCKELSRLPILWMKQSNRTVEQIHEYLTEHLDITKDKVQRFLNRISVVYANMDNEFTHGVDIDPVTISLDIKVIVDDVPIGLGLQRHTPYKFVCNYLWVKPIPDVGLSPHSLSAFLDCSKITHFQFEDSSFNQNEARLEMLFNALSGLHMLRALSLPDCIDATVNQTMATSLNRILKGLRYLQRLNLSYCNLSGQLGNILSGMRTSMQYLNLKDCRLTVDDLFFLAHWRPLTGLREFNLSCNNLSHIDQVAIALLERMPHLTCLSFSRCSLGPASLLLIARECKECSRLKVLCLQGFTPLTEQDCVQVLDICAQIRGLQKAILFPDAFGFPGENDQERRLRKYHTLLFCYHYLEQKGRTDLMLE